MLFSKYLTLVCIGLFCIISSNTLVGQDRLKAMPGYDQYQAKASKIRGSVKQGKIKALWADDSKSFAYNWDGKKVEFNVKKKKSNVIGDALKNRA